MRGSSSARQLGLRSRPPGRSFLRQRWRSLLFLHWAVDPEVLRPRVPAELSLDLYEEKAYLGLVPFFLEWRSIGSMALPEGWFDFPEINVRTYVVDALGRPGVWFFSLDAALRLAVAGARFLYRLPYFFSRIEMEGDPTDRGVHYQVDRREDRQAKSRFFWKAAGPPREAEPGSLSFFLIERYLLFSRSRRGGDRWARIWHSPYPIQELTECRWDTALLGADGLPEPAGQPDHAVASPGVDVEIFWPRRAGEED
ncbi:YqjF family protein [Verrucomicrobium sp. 3C]|uniref:YqjF family protein n=1 Tax=Verrucomicrobium sp. 3C TaxID=1134055 RepID=UPI0003629A36|nr:DUF2071 domain-containing protein [Verrucomicrobium sp. 3C]